MRKPDVSPYRQISFFDGSKIRQVNVGFNIGLRI
jgi:hypothetical protein